jgi:polyribonucleotide nucleotidyltransferase
LLHVSEIAEHRVKDVKDELREGDQVLVKVLAIEGNRIKLSRKAVLKEQRAKLGLPEPEVEQASSERAPRPARPAAPSPTETITLEGGEDFDEEDDLDDEGEDEGDESETEGSEAPTPGEGGAPQGQRKRRRRRGGRRGPGGNAGAPRA